MPDPAVQPAAPAPLTALDLSERLQARLHCLLADGKCLPSYGALDLAAARPKLRVPCTAVVPLDDRPGPPLQPDVDVRVVQQVRTTVAVILGVAAPGTAALDGAPGDKAATAGRLRKPLAAVRAAVLGWDPRRDPDADVPRCPKLRCPRRDGPGPLDEGTWRPLVLQRGRLLSLAEGRAWWQDEYSSDWLLRSRPRKEAPGLARGEVCVSVNGAPPVPLFRREAEEAQ